MGSVAYRDPLKPPSEDRARGGIAPLGSVPHGSVPRESIPRGSVPRESIQLQSVFGGARRRPALGGPLPFVAAAVVLGIVAVLVSGNRGESPAKPGAIERGVTQPESIKPGSIEPRPIDPGAVEPEGKAPSRPPVSIPIVRAKRPGR